VTAGVPFSLQLAGSDPEGEPLTFSAVNLPPGLAINSSTGLISGTVPLSEVDIDYHVTAAANDGEVSANRKFWLDIV